MAVLMVTFLTMSVLSTQVNKNDFDYIFKNVKAVRHDPEVLNTRRENWDYWKYDLLHQQEMEFREKHYRKKVERDMRQAQGIKSTFVPKD